jgi:SAM-dependent methyltransferase
MTELSDKSRQPILGWARRAKGEPKTISVFLNGIERIAPNMSGDRFLDVGCGEGTFTSRLAINFAEVHGVDVQLKYAEEFATTGIGTFHHASASELPFPSEYFDTVLSIETLEHVDDLPRTCSEISRVLKQSAMIVLTVPNRWYPMEGHGGRIFGQEFTRLPLITWIPPLHRRVANARVFTVRDLDRLFVPLGFRRTGLSYLWPTFEHGASERYLKLQRALRWLFPLMRLMERGPLRLLGSSILIKYERFAGTT